MSQQAHLVGRVSHNPGSNAFLLHLDMLQMTLFYQPDECRAFLLFALLYHGVAQSPGGSLLILWVR